MRIIFSLIILILSINIIPSYATITAGNIPNVYANNCGPSSNSPCSHNSPAWTDGINVGIASVSPVQALDVQGTIRSTGQIINGTLGIGTTVPNSPSGISIYTPNAENFYPNAPAPGSSNTSLIGASTNNFGSSINPVFTGFYNIASGTNTKYINPFSNNMNVGYGLYGHCINTGSTSGITNGGHCVGLMGHAEDISSSMLLMGVEGRTEIYGDGPARGVLGLIADQNPSYNNEADAFYAQFLNPVSSGTYNGINIPTIGIGNAHSIYAQSDPAYFGGNVGIGSLSPGNKLDVQGTVRALFFSGNGSGLTGLPSGGVPGGVNGNIQYNINNAFTGATNVNTNGNTISTANWLDCKVVANADGSICAGVNTTTTGTISSGTNSLSVTSATGWTVGMGIAVHNAGAGGTAELISYVTAISGTTFTLNNNAVTTSISQTVNHDDTRALTDAVQSGLNLHLSSGKYNVTSAIAFTGPIMIQGDGNLDNMQGSLPLGTTYSVIINRGTTNNVLDWTALNQINYVKIFDLSIQQASGITPTAGYAIILGNNSNTQSVHDCTIQRVSIMNTFSGVSIQNHVLLLFMDQDDIRVKGGSGSTALNYAVPLPNGNENIQNSNFSSLSTGGHTVQITASDTTEFTHDAFNGGTNALYISDDVAAVAHINFVACTIENGDNVDPLVIIQAATPNNVDLISFAGSEFGVNSTNPTLVSGIQILTGARNITFQGDIFQAFAGIGVNVASTQGHVSFIGNVCDGTSPVAFRISPTGPPPGIVFIGNPTCSILNAGNINTTTTIEYGNVGIGTTNSPASNLFVQGNSILNGNTSINTPNQINSLDVQGGVALGTYGGINTAPTNGLILNGNVGINTFNPTQILDVRGASSVVYAPATPTTSTSKIQLVNTDTTNGNAEGIPFTMVNSSGALATAAIINGINTNHTASSESADLSFANRLAGSITEKMILKSSGNLGIGSSTPGQLLDVQGSVRMLGFNIKAGASAGLVLTSDANGFGSWASGSGGGGVGVGTVNAGTPNYLSVYQAQPKTLGPSGIPVVDNGTNFGIGTVSPGMQLDVQGTVRATGFNLVAGAGTGKVLTSDTNGFGSWATAGSGSGTVTSSTVNTVARYNTTGTTVQGSSILFADSTNVGIGSVNPTQILELEAASPALSFNNSSSSNKQWRLTANGANMQFTETGVGVIQTWQAGGNVGIGSITPGQMLDVQGTIRSIALQGGTGTASLTANGTSWSTGANLGVGSATPGQLLDVQGTVRISILGSTLAIKSGTNGCQGQATLASGTVTVSTACAPSSSQGIFLQDATTGSLVNVGTPTVGTITGGTSFVINSSNALDSSNVNWWILKAS